MLPEAERKAKLRSFGFVDRVMFRLDAHAQYTDWEDRFAGPIKGSGGSKKMPLQDADANVIQRHLALEHFRGTCSQSRESRDAYYAAVLPLSAGPVVQEGNFPFREMRAALSRVQKLDACVEGSGEIALFEADAGALASSNDSWHHHVSHDLASNLSQHDGPGRCVLFKVQAWRPSLLKQVKGACMSSLTVSDVCSRHLVSCAGG